jgi:hypothetical protein
MILSVKKPKISGPAETVIEIGELLLGKSHPSPAKGGMKGIYPNITQGLTVIEI